MAARFGAAIVPFGAVGEDDLVEVTYPFCYFSRLNSYFVHNTLLKLQFIVFATLKYYLGGCVVHVE